jgi:hypothetical protein
MQMQIRIRIRIWPLEKGFAALCVFLWVPASRVKTERGLPSTMLAIESAEPMDPAITSPVLTTGLTESGVIDVTNSYDG